MEYQNAVRAAHQGSVVECKLEVTVEQFDRVANQLKNYISVGMEQEDKYFDIGSGYLKLRVESIKWAHVLRSMSDVLKVVQVRQSMSDVLEESRVRQGRTGIDWYTDERSLIRYDREVISKRMMTRYSKMRVVHGVCNHRPISDELKILFGVCCVVVKDRTVYVKGQMRIHLDYVHELDRWFIEFLYVKEDNEEPDVVGENEIIRYVEKLGLQDAKVWTCSYYDLVK